MRNQTSEKKTKKHLLLYSKDNFPMYDVWFKDFFKIHNQIFEFIGENLENFYKKFDEIFFEWFNQHKNQSKFMFEVKKEFMYIADEVLLYEISDYQQKKTEYCFVIGPFQKYLEFMANDDSPIQDDIDMYPDINPDYSLLENHPIIQDNTEENDFDDKYYLSFFE
jgi:hypothetical protein